MLTIVFSALLFFLLLGLGNLLMILDTTAYTLIPLFVLSLLLCKLFYHEANCKAMELRDFFLTQGIVMLFLGYYGWQKEPFTVTIYWYLYLITFISLMMFANSIRFKSLI